MQKHNSTSYISRHTVLYYSYQNGRIAIGECSFGEVYVYDGNGNTARCTVVEASGNAIAEYRYEYDSLGMSLIHISFAAAYFAGQPLHIAGYGDSGIVFSLLDSQAGGEVVSRAPAGPASAPEAEAPSEPYTASAEETPAASSAPEADFSFQGSEHDIREVPEAQVPSEPAATASPEATSPQPEATAPEPIATESAGFLDPTGPDTPEAESGSLEGPEETAPEETGVPAVVTNPYGTVLACTGDGEAADPAEYASPATSEPVSYTHRRDDLGSVA